MGRAQSQVSVRREDPFAGVLPQRRGIKSEGLLTHAPTHHDRDELEALKRQLQAGQSHPALRLLQEHATEEAPLLNELYEASLTQLLHEQELRAQTAQTYLTILGLQKGFEGRACMADTADTRLQSLSPEHRKRTVSRIHLRLEAGGDPVCYVDGGVGEERQVWYAATSMKDVPYPLWEKARLDTRNLDRVPMPCGDCSDFFYDIQNSDRGMVAWLDGDVESKSGADIRTRLDTALRARLGRSAPIAPRTGYNLAAKQYRYGICAPAARTLRSDQRAFEELCFLPEHKKQVKRLQALTKTPLREILSEEQWLEILVRDFPSSIKQALSSGVTHGYYANAALFAIEKTLGEQDEL